MLLSEQFTQLMEAIKTSKKEPSIKLAEFKSEIREMQKRATASVIKKVQLGQELYSFKTKNSSRWVVDEALFEAETEIDTVLPSSTILTSIKRHKIT